MEIQENSKGNIYVIPYAGASSFINAAGYTPRSYEFDYSLAKVNHNESLHFSKYRGFDRYAAEETLKAIAKDKNAKGVMVMGGGDVDARIYRAEKNPHNWDSNKEQDLAEMMVIQNSPVPVFGICRGMQLMHVALSRNEEAAPLDQHLEDHLIETRSSHPLRYVKDWPKYGYRTGDVSKVNSLHHQGVMWRDTLREEFPNMVVLAVTLQAHPVVEVAVWENFKGQEIVGVQYHPEMLIRAEDIEMIQKLFG